MTDDAIDLGDGLSLVIVPADARDAVRKIVAERDDAIIQRTAWEFSARQMEAERDRLREALLAVSHSTGCCDACPCHMNATRKARKILAALTTKGDTDDPAVILAAALELPEVKALIRAAQDAEYDLHEWVQCAEWLEKAGFNMDGTPQVLNALSRALVALKLDAKGDTDDRA